MITVCVAALPVQTCWCVEIRILQGGKQRACCLISAAEELALCDEECEVG